MKEARQERPGKRETRQESGKAGEIKAKQERDKAKER